MLPDRSDVVIVGGGVIGVSIAFHLAEAGVRDVLLLERGPLGGGSTSKAAGGVRAQFSDPVNIELGARSLDAFEAFARRPGQPIDLRQPGYLFLLTTDEQVGVFEDSIRRQNDLGVRSVLVPPDEAARLSPGALTGDVVAGAFHGRDGYCSPDSVVLGYASAARRMGVRALTGITVTGMRCSGGEVTAVETDAGTVATHTVIVAAGAWSRGVAALAAVALPVVPLRRQILVSAPLPERLLSTYPESMPMTIDAATTLYLHREGPGVLFGMSYAAEEPGFALEYSEEWLDDLTAAIARRSPALLDVGIAHRWAGLYEVTPDHNALIGEDESVSRLLYATGFSGHGFLQAPAVGEVVRDLYLRRPPIIDVSPLSATRFDRDVRREEAAIV